MVLHTPKASTPQPHKRPSCISMHRNASVCESPCKERVKNAKQQALLKLLCNVCGEHQAEEQEENNPKKTIRREKASTQYILACKER